MRVGAVVPAAGRGTRFGSSQNKIWEHIAGRPLLEWTLRALDSHPRIDAVVVAGAPEELERIRQCAAPFATVARVVPGGASRAESVGRGLSALPEPCGMVLVHDAARPLVSQALITRVLEAVERHGAAVPGLPVSDTLKRVGPDGKVESTVSREGLWAVQTPQGALRSLLASAYERLGPAVAACTDEAAVLEAAGIAVWAVPGEEANIKVTVPADLERAARALAPGRECAVRTGFGFDVHAFAHNRPLWLGGVLIPHARGLAGHSDADVVLHALCDALLGAAALGDIGALFPDTDPAHKDRSSREFVREVRERLARAGWSVANVDVALAAEEPRVGPHRAQMAAAIAQDLGITAEQVSIKATTTERMGFVGRGEGIACWAVATLKRPL